MSFLVGHHAELNKVAIYFYNNNNKYNYISYFYISHIFSPKALSYGIQTAGVTAEETTATG